MPSIPDGLPPAVAVTYCVPAVEGASSGPENETTGWLLSIDTVFVYSSRGSRPPQRQSREWSAADGRRRSRRSEWFAPPAARRTDATPLDSVSSSSRDRVAVDGRDSAHRPDGELPQNTSGQLPRTHPDVCQRPARCSEPRSLRFGGVRLMLSTVSWRDGCCHCSCSSRRRLGSQSTTSSVRTH